MKVARLPGADRRFTGSHEQGSFHSQAVPTTQWLNDSVPNIDPEAWRLSLVVGTMQQLSLVELEGYNDEIEAALVCTGGWYSRQRWGRGAARSVARRSRGSEQSREVGDRVPPTLPPGRRRPPSAGRTWEENH